MEECEVSTDTVETETRAGSAKIPLSLEVEHFGPVRAGKVELRPLTIFIGPNNSGKSYIATLLHSILRSFQVHIRYLWGFVGPPLARRPARGRRFRAHEEVLAVARRRLEGILPGLEPGREFDVPPEAMGVIGSMVLQILYEERVSREIARSFGCPPRELATIGQDSFALRIAFDSCETCVVSSGERLDVVEYPLHYPQVPVRVSTQAGPGVGSDVRRPGDHVAVRLRFPKSESGGRAADMLVEELLDLSADSMLAHVAVPCYYLPAARSGILQAHKALAASIVQGAPYAGLRVLDIPTLSGPVADFISSLITLPEEGGPMYALAQALERELIKGEIVLGQVGEERYPEIKYSFQDVQIPLRRASSTVSELAALSLYLKYLVEAESVVIVEEPEAHLHPENQRLLARFLVRLVRAGVALLLTTHSEYLLEQLNNFVLLSRISPEERAERHGFEPGDYLKPEELGLYLFARDEGAPTHSITAVQVDSEDGIPRDEFARVYESLYEEEIRLRRALEPEA